MLRSITFAASLVGVASDCTYSGQTEPTEQCMDAVPNPTGTDVDSCQKACCDDPACDAYQWTDSDPITFAPSCLTGTCNTPQDCGANPIPCQWTGEQGKTGGGAPAKPPPGQPGGDTKKGEDEWGHDFLLFGGLFAGLYVFGTMGYNFKVKEASGRELLPHPDFWGSLGGLVKDGVAFAMKKDDGAGDPGGGSYQTVGDAYNDVPSAD